MRVSKIVYDELIVDSYVPYDKVDKWNHILGIEMCSNEFLEHYKNI